MLHLKKWGVAIQAGSSANRLRNEDKLSTEDQTAFHPNRVLEKTFLRTGRGCLALPTEGF